MPTLYFKDMTDPPSAGGDWSVPANWFYDYEATLPTGVAPWLADDWTKTYDLARSQASEAYDSYIYLQGAYIGDYVTGACTIPTYPAGYYGLELASTWVYGGAFYGDMISVNGGEVAGSCSMVAGTIGLLNFCNIYAGNFTGLVTLNNAFVLGGVFPSDYCSITDSLVLGGVFLGDYLSYNSSGSNIIKAGVFTGRFFTRSSGAIGGGIFCGEGFTDSGGGDAGGLWLESGTLYVANHIPNEDTSVRYRVSGTNQPNPYASTPSNGFHTLRIPGQDVLGTGLL